MTQTSARALAHAVEALPDTLIFVLPAYNEESSLADLLARIDAVMREPGQRYRVIVVDDGSSDATPAIARDAAKRLPVELLVNERNLGLGGPSPAAFVAPPRPRASTTRS